MSCPDDALEALARGELSGRAARATRAHVATCAACARELTWLVRERAAIARVVHSETPLPPAAFALARALPPPLPQSEPRFAWATGIFALGLAPMAAIVAIIALGGPLPVATPRDAELAASDSAPACFLGGDGAEGGVARVEAIYAACLLASPGPSRGDDRGVTEALFSPYGREACE